MAQHLPTRHFDQQIFRKIESGIRKNFAKAGNYGMRTSMRYRFIQERDGIDIYTVERRIPSGIVFGSETGTIEIHYDRKNQQLLEIYLVA